MIYSVQLTCWDTDKSNSMMVWGYLVWSGTGMEFWWKCLSVNGTFEDKKRGIWMTLIRMLAAHRTCSGPCLLCGLQYQGCWILCAYIRRALVVTTISARNLCFRVRSTDAFPRYESYTLSQHETHLSITTSDSKGKTNDLSSCWTPFSRSDWLEVCCRGGGGSRTMRSHFTLNLPYYYHDIHIYLRSAPRII